MEMKQRWSGKEKTLQPAGVRKGVNGQYILLMGEKEVKGKNLQARPLSTYLLYYNCSHLSTTIYSKYRFYRQKVVCP